MNFFKGCVSSKNVSREQTNTLRVSLYRPIQNRFLSAAAVVCTAAAAAAGSNSCRARRRFSWLGALLWSSSALECAPEEGAARVVFRELVGGRGQKSVEPFQILASECQDVWCGVRGEDGGLKGAAEHNSGSEWTVNTGVCAGGGWRRGCPELNGVLCCAVKCCAVGCAEDLPEPSGNWSGQSVAARGSNS